VCAIVQMMSLVEGYAAGRPLEDYASETPAHIHSLAEFSMINNDKSANQISALPSISAWKAAIARFQSSSPHKAVWQLINTFVPYAILWYAMYRSVSMAYWLTLPLAVLAAGFLARIFIIFHDCGHGSFFKSKSANRAVGFLCGLLTLTPYGHWHWQHALHHRSSGDLDRRGAGDIWTLTVREYLESSRWRRLAYRLARNPFVLFVLAPLYLFVIDQRFPSSAAPAGARRSVHWMNLAIIAMACTLSALMGIKTYLFIQLLVSALAGAAGIWLFYVQHQFEGTYWQRGNDWSYTAAAFNGSSFYKLPSILQWFSGNIGFHHIHHLSPRIPNYNLQRCHEASSLFRTVKPISLLLSLRCLTFRLWDEQRGQLVGYRRSSWDRGTADSDPT
jgi:omega-6 fatty acid desaturase (delta-12 desaturase)